MIEENAKLTINNDVNFYKDICLIVRSGGTLIIDGCTINDANIIIEAGGNIEIKHNGIINICANEKFSLPLQSRIKIEEGKIITNQSPL